MTKQPKKPLSETITVKQIEDALKARVVATGKTEDDKKRKADWFKKHVIVMKA